MQGQRYAPPMLNKGSYANDNSMLKIKNYSLVMKIMCKAVELTIAEGSGDKKRLREPGIPNPDELLRCIAPAKYTNFWQNEGQRPDRNVGDE